MRTRANYNRSMKTRLNKSAWIRAQPASLSAKDVVEKAQREGIELSSAMVYTVRSLATKAGSAARAPRSAGPRAAASTRTARSAPEAASLRVQFQKIVVRIGTEEAQRLLTRVQPLVLAEL
jgi:hypothetical protein